MKTEHTNLFLSHCLTFPLTECKFNTVLGQDKNMKDYLLCWVSASS